MTQNIFLSYRRDDSRGYTNAIYTLLELHFPSDSIFMDVDTLVPGSDFVQSQQDAVEACDIFLAVIGKSWENIEDQKGIRRLEHPEDFVRIEVAHALMRGIPVIPVLVDGAQMPSSENLPDNLKDLARRHAFSIGDHMRSDVQRLIKVLEKTFERLEKERLEREKKEAELLVKAQAEADRIAKEKAEADRKAKGQAEADRIAKEKAEADRKAKGQAEADRIAKEKAEADLKAQEKAEADRKAKEQAETVRKVKEKDEADRKAKEKAEADRKAKNKAEVDRKARKEAARKARALAAVEKKEADDKKRLSRQKTKTTAAQQEEKSTSPSPSALNKIPVWVWPVVGVVIITIVYGIFGGFLPFLSQTPGTIESAQSVIVDTDTPTTASTTNTPTPEATITLTAVITAIPTEEPHAGAENTNSKDLAVMVYVPSGEFIMGSDSGESNESPEHIIYLDGYWIYQTEVTYAMIRLCVESGGCLNDTWQTEKLYDDAFADHPVTGVTWRMANNYCLWAGGRLPTEAEWEKAARGPDGLIYPWSAGGNYYLANYNGIIFDTTPVGSYPEGASPYGLLDMAGNAAEWVADWYDGGYYKNSPLENPPGPDDGLERIVRGGSWVSSWEEIRAAKRYTVLSHYVAEYSNYYGFRCAVSHQP